VGGLTVPASDANDGTHDILAVGGLDITDPYVRVALLEEGPWTFSDEIQFFGGASSVPDSADNFWLLTGSVLLLATLRNRVLAARRA